MLGVDDLFCFQAEDGIRDLVRSRGLGDVYKRQIQNIVCHLKGQTEVEGVIAQRLAVRLAALAEDHSCLLYTSDAADERSSVDLGGRRIIKKKKNGRER